MNGRRGLLVICALISAVLTTSSLAYQVPATPPRDSQPDLERVLTEISIAKLEELYASRHVTVTQVTQWHLDRIARYDTRYRALLKLDRAGALRTARAEDAAAAKGGAKFKRGPLWGVPVVIKANTSVQGWTTSVGWKGYLSPGHELIAPMDAAIVAKLRAAGAVIIGQTNMPDFAAGDTTNSTAGGRTGNAYNWRYSPGGSSGGTATAVAADLAVFGIGTDTSNSMRLPAASSGLVAILPTHGLVSTAGIHPLDWLLDNAGPMTRTVTDAAIVLDVIADGRHRRGTAGDQASYMPYLRSSALKGKRFGVPAFVVKQSGRGMLLGPQARNVFLRAVEELKAAGATVVFDDGILPDSFTALIDNVHTSAYRREGVEQFLRRYGSPEYRFTANWEMVSGTRLPAFLIGAPGEEQRVFENDPRANANFWVPQKRALAVYEQTLEQFHLDGYVYPPVQIVSRDETEPLRKTAASGPHGNTGWVNIIGVPAIVIPAGVDTNGIPVGLEFSGRRSQEGDLLSWAFSYEQATKHRKPPILKERQTAAGK